MNKIISKKAFTLVELLVVISIIAMLLSILVPVLGKVRYQAKRLKCTTYVRQQIISMVAHGNDNRYRFPKHNGWLPYVIKNGNREDMGDNYCSVWEEYQPYFPNPEITICPLKKTDKLSNTFWSDPYYVVYDISEMGGWGSKVYGTGEIPLYIGLSYNWFGGYLLSPNRKSWEFKEDDAPWPKSWQDASSRTTLVTHITFSGTALGLYDYSHGGKGWERTNKPDFSKAGKSLDNPVGRGDGSVTYRTRTQMRNRGTVNDSAWNCDIFFWY